MKSFKRTKQRRRYTPESSLRVESLEGRLVLSASVDFSIADRIVSITGTEGSDSVVVEQQGRDLVISITSSDGMVSETVPESTSTLTTMAITSAMKTTMIAGGCSSVNPLPAKEAAITTNRLITMTVSRTTTTMMMIVIETPTMISTITMIRYRLVPTRPPTLFRWSSTRSTPRLLQAHCLSRAHRPCMPSRGPRRRCSPSASSRMRAGVIQRCRYTIP